MEAGHEDADEGMLPPVPGDQEEHEAPIRPTTCTETRINPLTNALDSMRHAVAS
jgi:hypothetical protein